MFNQVMADAPASPPIGHGDPQYGRVLHVAPLAAFQRELADDATIDFGHQKQAVLRVCHLANDAGFGFHRWRELVGLGDEVDARFGE